MTARFTIPARCLHCGQVVPTASDRGGPFLMWQHKLETGEDCPAWKRGTDHEPVDAQSKREQLERERAARVVEPLRPNAFPSWREAREIDAAAAAEDDYSGDYRDRRAGGSRW